MTVPIRQLLAIGLATAGISITLAAPAAAAPSTSNSQHVVRASTKATPTSHKSAQSAAPTSNKRVLSSDGATSGAVKHHWGTHHGHGLL
jgi:hypothetical protein